MTPGGTMRPIKSIADIYNASDIKFSHIYGYGALSDSPFKVSMFKRLVEKNLPEFNKRMSANGVKPNSSLYKNALDAFYKEQATTVGKHLSDYRTLPAGVKTLSSTTIPFLTWSWFAFGKAPEIVGMHPNWAATLYTAQKAIQAMALGDANKSHEDDVHWFGLTPYSKHASSGSPGDIEYNDSFRTVPLGIPFDVARAYTLDPGLSAGGVLWRQFSRLPFAQGMYTVEKGHNPFQGVKTWQQYLKPTNAFSSAGAKTLDLVSPFLFPYWSEQLFKRYIPSLRGERVKDWPAGYITPSTAITRFLFGNRQTSISPSKLNNVAGNKIRRSARSFRRENPSYKSAYHDMIQQSIRAQEGRR